MTFRIACIVAALAVAGCGGGADAPTVEQDGDTTTITSTNEQGESSTVITQSGDAVTAPDLPSYAPLYPGAKVTNTMTADAPEGAGVVVGFTTTDAPAKVADFCRARFKAEGFPNLSDASTGEQIMLAASKDQLSATVVINAAEGGGSMVQLMAGKGQ
jgi:hypothetical protein